MQIGEEVAPGSITEEGIRPYDFRRPDRIAKHQLRSIHLLHENFARSLASSLSAFLRTYTAVSLKSVEQLSFAAFSQRLPTPACGLSLNLRPHEGSALLEISHSVVYPIIEMLLGGSGTRSLKIDRELTEIEKSILEGVLRIILQDLKAAWHSVTTIDFLVERHETDPQLLQILSPAEAVVAVSLELRIGESVGLMHIGIPSILVKMLQHQLDQQWSVRRAQSTESESARMWRLLKMAQVRADARLEGPTLLLKELLNVEPGDILKFDHSVDKPLQLTINDQPKFLGSIVKAGNNRALEISQEYRSGD